MARRRIEALRLLTRIRRYEMEQDAAELGTLRHAIALLQAEDLSLQERMRREISERSLESAPYIGDFLRAVRAEQGRIQLAEAGLVGQAEALEEAVLARYREIRSFDLVLERALAQVAQEERKAEAAEIDAHALQTWPRRGPGA